jgi:hypothetical protein
MRIQNSKALKTALLVWCLFQTTIAQSQSSTWVVQKNEWTVQDENNFSDWIAQIGVSGCRTFDECIKSQKSNPQYATLTPKNFFFAADCADLPYMFRAYFAWANQLPFDYVSRVTPSDPNESTVDIRYTLGGNKPMGKRVIDRNRSSDLIREMKIIRDGISTAFYRVHYNYNSDFYPTKIDRANIRPGTVVYDPSGHAAIVFKIESNGLIRMMDGHPDNTLTRIVFSKAFQLSRPEHGAGFRNWRPELNRENVTMLSGFSTEMFEKAFVIQGKSSNYYDFVRFQMANGVLKYNPLQELKAQIKELCSNAKDRIKAVQLAIDAGIDHQAHPEKLPDNIFGAVGEWEEYSSPSRDLRLRLGFLDTFKETQKYIQWYAANDPRLEFTPKPNKYTALCAGDKKCLLAAEMLLTYDSTASSPECRFSYVKSNSQVQNLDYDDLVRRLFLLSFDPYHCVELRWGATGQELQSCQQDADKMAWYNSQQRLRNHLEKDTTAFMGYTKEEAAKLLGSATAPDVDLKAELLEHIVQGKQFTPVR